jgi:hypothetical protein
LEGLKPLTEAARLGDRGQQSIVSAFFQALFSILSDGTVVRHPEGGTLRATAPLRVCGRGRVVVRGAVTLGVFHSPYFLQGVYLEARTPTSQIFLDDGA